MNNGIITGLSVLGSLAVIGLIYKFVWKRKKNKSNIGFEKYFIEELDLEEVIAWAKEHSDLLKQNQDYISILIKGDSELSKSISGVTQIDFVQAIFDSSKGEIILGRIIQTNRLNAELIQMFGDKDMVVFQ